MAHLGSAWVASVKALSAAAYWKEWSCAIPFKTAACAAEEQELGKTTFPRLSEVPELAATCPARPVESDAKTIKISENLRSNIFKIFPMGAVK
jgi:hypothetical protein